MYLVPPMADDPPPEFVAFVAGHLNALRRETERLVGGDPEGAHIYMEVLADVAGHWRRLIWWGRLAGGDRANEYMKHRLTKRTKQWRDEQIYEVDIRVLRQYTPLPVSVTASMALRKAEVLPGTVRSGRIAYAEAGIAWVKAYRKQEWHRIGRLAVTGIVLVGGMIEAMSWLSSGY